METFLRDHFEIVQSISFHISCAFFPPQLKVRFFSVDNTHIKKVFSHHFSSGWQGWWIHVWGHKFVGGSTRLSRRTFSPLPMVGTLQAPMVRDHLDRSRSITKNDEVWFGMSVNLQNDYEKVNNEGTFANSWTKSMI